MPTSQIHSTCSALSTRRTGLRRGARRATQRTEAQPLDLVRVSPAAGSGPQPDGAALRDFVARRGAGLSGARRARPAAAGMHAAGRGDRRPLGRRDLRLARQPEGALVDDAVRARDRRQRRFPRGAGQVLRRRGGPGDRRAAQRGGDDQPAVRLDLGLADDRLRRRARPRDDLALDRSRVRAATATSAHRRR